MDVNKIDAVEIYATASVIENMFGITLAILYSVFADPDDGDLRSVYVKYYMGREEYHCTLTNLSLPISIVLKDTLNRNLHNGHFITPDKNTALMYLGSLNRHIVQKATMQLTQECQAML